MIPLPDETVMGRKDYVFHIPQRGIFRQGFGCTHIQNSAEGAAGLQPVDQRVLIHKCSTRDIDEYCVRRKRLKHFPANQSARLIRQRQTGNQNICLFYCALQLTQRQDFIELFSCVDRSIDADQAAAKGSHPLCDLPPDITGTDDADSLSIEFSQISLFFPAVCSL